MAEGTLTLPDGRTIAWMDYNDFPEDTKQPTLFYFHGFPGSRLEGDLVAPTAKGHSTRVISMDRPGMGLSTFQPNRTVLDWPKDVLAVADHLRIQKFYVLGCSGGSPYALACVHAISRDRLLGASVVAGLYPAGLGTAGMTMGNRVLLWTASSEWIGGWTGPLMDMMIGRVARDYDHPDRLKEWFIKEMKSKPAPDAACVEDEWTTERIVEATRESFRQGGEGVALDIKLIAKDWGFELQDLNTDGLGMYLWHGGQDVNVPLAMAEKAAKLMGGVELKVLEEEAHLSASLKHQDEILTALLGGMT
ncbi:hypothetical protein LTR10_020757 [Elasticomyces elasticus]|uniref:AB hydrolase-1 domain-containing protein n=1 Tax=Exophiala sideris TaxID=1016849 RepID=A0ABR0J6W7_9EURO|nr:hypothetical protein LTR10_020757 [Elasticomyces elasticus]KAK5028858.1 hypothetical protein LTS07_006238 [Exophiala sideris]KAK5035727.1 hypothetical protein LTR13_005857 [Exophiala sideris]KAK5057362.1 hypothetical protein LTR69_007402 [Exophiala sideris]KAK5181664.1 hypothetical protein LTR44_005863 [Eurotiomycetes sp. CCFEE 6388]